MIRIILVEQTAQFWNGTDSSSTSEQAKQCSENSTKNTEDTEGSEMESDDGSFFFINCSS
jgi:hypothetical protein